MSSHPSTTEPVEPKKTQEDRIKERLDRVKYRPRSIQGSVKRFTNCKNISIVAPLEMYDGPWREWIEYEAILDLHIEGKIDITFIHWWTMHLYSKAKRLPDNKCTFLNPHLITSSQCRSKENEVIEHIMDTKRLNPGKDIYMAPYMQGDSHWVLMVLCPNSRKGYIVDSYEYEKKNENNYYFPAIVESALDTKFDWTMVKCFQQKGGWECGYYMMKFMFDLVINKQADFPHSLWDDSRRLKPLEIDQVALLTLNEFYSVVNVKFGYYCLCMRVTIGSAAKDIERLVNNLCTVWIGRFKLMANLARFKRENKTGRGKEGRTENGENIRHKFCTSSNAGSFGNGKSFVSVVKKINKESETEFVPSIVLDDECLNKKDLSMSLMGRVKEMASLANLKKVLCNEGFDNLKISYLGELWVLLEFESSKAKELFRKNAGAGSWFSVLHLANDECVPDGRLAWVEVGGVPFKLWTVKTFSRIASKWGDLMDVDEDELNYHSKRLCVFTKVRQNIQESFKVNFRGKVHWVRAIEVPGWIPEFNDEEEEDDVSDECNFDGKPEAQEENNIFEESEEEKVQETEFGVPSGEKVNKSEDPFGIYSLLQKNKTNMENKVNEEDHSLSHPPGFTPEVDQFEGNAMGDIAEKVYTEKENDVNSFVNKDIGNNDSNSVNNNVEPTDLDRSKLLRSGGSILNFMEEVVKVGQTMGYNMEGCIKDINDIIESQGEFGETKMGTMDLNTVRSCWGNSIFEYVQSDSVGYSGGILCIWDPNSFRRNSFTRSDYFVIIRGVWLKSGIDLLIVVVYAPQDAKEKHMLWEYLTHISNSWDGKIVMMGDFNEVRFKSDRFGSNFNVHEAEKFNSFIYNAGMEEVSLGGSAFTWCHRSASKMSKLDRFFVSENLLTSCPNISAITLERFISDHRPILLRETSFDYGPIPFRFYKYWLEVDGFDKMVRESWEAAPGNKDNAIRSFMGKLKFLKDRIRVWLSIHKANSRSDTDILKEELRLCDELIDKGMGSSEVVQNRLEILNKIHQVQKNQASEISQKAKIKWAIEGDENVKFFHGILNKKRSQSQIRGVMANGVWIDDPVKVKDEFLMHFRSSLHISFQRVVDAGLFNGINLSSTVNLSHLFYADDAIFIGQWNELNIDTLVRVLECFFRASGLRINMSKSKIMGVNVEDAKVKIAANKLGCLVLKTPFTYLGTKVGENMHRKHAWNEVVEKVLSRLSRWKLKTLSIGGRFTLLKSVLGSMPIFHMSIFKVPSSILNSLEVIRSRFFNGHEHKSNKATWFKWNKVLTSKEKGGLGVSSLFALNRGLLFKWLWRFYSQKDSLWTKVIKALYGEDGSLDKVGASAARTCWTTIVQEVKVIQAQGINIHDFIKLKLGNGEDSRFWLDKWYEGGVLKRLFPRVYALELDKNISVSSKLKAPSLVTTFRRNARSGIEQTQFDSMAEIMKTISLVPRVDRYIWSLENDGSFSVASIRKTLDDNRFQEESLSTRWVKSVPIKVNILAWKVKSNALPTRFNISRRGMDIDSIDCPICKMGVETTSHVFFQCNVVRQVMRKISSWWNVEYMEVNSYEEWRSWLVSTRIRSNIKVIIEGIYYGLWSIFCIKSSSRHEVINPKSSLPL
ncbi:RNA-directed DNA polymerase, eukaryota [Tanacetum coccineum]